MNNGNTNQELVETEQNP